MAKVLQNSLPNAEVVTNDILVLWSEDITYLSKMDSKLSGSRLVQCMAKRFWGKIVENYPFINRRSKLNLFNKLFLYKICFLPSIMYASAVGIGSIIPYFQTRSHRESGIKDHQRRLLLP